MGLSLFIPVLGVLDEVVMLVGVAMEYLAIPPKRPGSVGRGIGSSLVQAVEANTSGSAVSADLQ